MTTTETEKDPVRERAATEYALECRAVGKIFPGVTALDAIDLKVRRGEVHALVGQNGAGKSTLVKILTGVYRPTRGDVLVEGRPVRLANPASTEAAGIVIVHQDQQLVGQFDATRNIILGREIVSAGLLDLGRMRIVAQGLLDRIGASFPCDRACARPQRCAAGCRGDCGGAVAGAQVRSSSTSRPPPSATPRRT